MPSDLERICRMLEAESPELQCAAAMVLGELKPPGDDVPRALHKALKASPEPVRLYLLEALAKIDTPAALPHLIPLLSGPEPGRSRAARALVSLGSEAARELRRHLGKADASARQGILEVLGQFKDVDASDALFAGLLDPDPDVARKAAYSCVQRVDAMTPEEKGRTLREVLEFMESPRVQKLREPLAYALQIVGAIRDASAAKKVLPYVDRRQPPAVRTAALQALARLALEGKAAADAAARLLPLLGEEDFGHIVRPALDVLEKIPAGRAAEDRLLKLIGSAQPPVRLYALQALGSMGTPAAAEALVEALSGQDPQAAERAEAALGSNPAYVPMMLKALDRQGDLTRAWKISNVLRTRKEILDKATVRKLLGRCLALLDKRAEIAPVYFEILRSAAPDLLRGALLKKGRELLKGGKFEEAERTLRLLHRDDLAAPETEFMLAVAQLRRQRLEPVLAGRDQGHAIQTFCRLARIEGFPLVKNLQEEEALLSPAGLLYLGFALTERQGSDRDAGAEILKFVARKHKAKEEGRVAKMKLKTQGIG
jgi:HEAT repeat protein